MTAADLPACDVLRALAGWNQTIDIWRQFLAAQPEGCFVAEEFGRIIGTVTSTRHESALAWIGMMLVHPDERRRGIGRALMEHCLSHLDALGVQCVKLDATPAGQPLYEQLGFISEWTLTRWSQCGCGAPLAQAQSICREYCAADWTRVIALDTETFGARRAGWLRTLIDRSKRVLVAETSGQIIGFGMLRRGASANYLGPLIAGSPTLAQSLIDELLATNAGEKVFWDIPDANTAAVELASTRGFERARPLTRMTRGKTGVSHQTQRTFAIADPALG